MRNRFEEMPSLRLSFGREKTLKEAYRPKMDFWAFFISEEFQKPFGILIEIKGE